MHRRSRTSRRELLALAGAVGLSALVPVRRIRAQPQSDLPPRLLFVVAAAGGASILESFLPVVDVEAGAQGAHLAVQPASLVHTVGGLRCVGRRGGDLSGLQVGARFLQQTFLEKHGSDTLVMTVESTSVNHLVGQKRMVTGANVNGGRTIQEATAEALGTSTLLPNVNMAQGGYVERGDDPTIDKRFLPEAVADARTFPLSLHGSRGVLGAPPSSLVDRARRVRDRLESESPFGRTFAQAPVRRELLEARTRLVADAEHRDLITKLMLVPDSPSGFPLSESGLAESPDGARVRSTFSKLVSDPFEAQAAMAFLLAKNGVSQAMTLAPSFAPVLEGITMENPPLAFDFSHNDHPGTQNAMWSRVLRVVDGLIDLLKAEPDGQGGSLWDRSLVYIATDFGREKTRPANAASFGTGHHLNNGVVMISPLLRGGRVYGGVDPTTLLTYGFDPSSGEPRPGTVMREADIYAVIAGAMGVNYPGRRAFPAIVR
jgi:hypothetical protein